MYIIHTILDRKLSTANIKIDWTYSYGRGILITNFKIMSPQKEKTIINFKKTQSLMAKIIKMVKEDKYCIDIMQQNLAAIGLLKSAHQMLMENHLNTCFRKAFESKNERKKRGMIKEILKVAKLYHK